MRGLNVAVVGLGWWGRIIVGAAEGQREAAAVVRASTSRPGSRRFCRENGLNFRATSRRRSTIPTVDGVVLCTPHTLHCEQIVRAANAKKHVFCEKPLSLIARRRAARGRRPATRNGVALAVGHEKRFEPPILELFRLARAGELGTLLQVEANFSQDKFLSLPADNWRLSEKEAPAGPMTATGIHLLDLSIGLLGPAEQRARARAPARQPAGRTATRWACWCASRAAPTR